MTQKVDQYKVLDEYLCPLLLLAYNNMNVSVSLFFFFFLSYVLHY